MTRRSVRDRTGRLAAAVAGVLAAAAAMGVAELAAGALGRPAASPVIAVGSGFVDLTPVWLKDWAIRAFGTNDKLVLLLGVGLGVVLAAVAAGLLAGRRLRRGLAGLAAVGAVGALAALTRPSGGAADALPTLVGVAAGMAVLTVLVHRLPVPSTRKMTGSGQGGAARETDGPEGDGPGTGTSSAPEAPEGGDGAPVAAVAAVSASAAGRGTGRRRFLLAGAGAVAVAGAGAAGGRFLLGRREVAKLRGSIDLPGPASPAPPVPRGAQVRVPGMTPFVTPNRDFYRVDTALTLPQVDPRDWTLRIHGMVDRPLEITFGELLDRELIERDITLSCVSNQVGGDLAGNARWLGAPLAPLLREAGVRRGTDQVLSSAADGMTIGTALDPVLDGRDAMLAVAMNGEPLPVKHGFPVRMVVPGLFGYVSATKWVVDLEITRFAADRAYWTERGYAERAPVKTFSRIDLPRPLARVRAGRVAVAGTAWAQHRGVRAVEWQVDDGPWREARLAPVPSTDTWRQWVAEWDAAPGGHTLRVRATDGTGATQPPERTPPFPDGATGWHSVVVTVT
ncbi:molybdopterin-dependent oxidoreductase [Actinomadura sp. WMMB 499]|uniref:molybdopterin-dependent oxidoreductase n=1 Tax=Actinomadura sp. WMMB 499 TaxID=1219491 RepID=UPI0034A0CE84